MNVGTLEIKLLANIARLQTDMDKANQTVDRAMGRINKSVVLAKNAFAGLTAAFGGAQILRMADDYKKFDAQLRLSTRTTQEYAAAYKSVVAIARQSQSDIAAVGVLYARLTNNLRDFGTTQKEIAGITEAVSLSLRVSNATVQETNSVMLQLSQSFGSGRINGQEFLAVSEGAPIIMRQLAKSLNTTVGALKDMSAQGKLTSDVLAKALADPEYVARLREQVKEVGTISSAWTVLVNNLKIFIGEADKASGASKILQSAIVGVGDSLQFLVTAGLVAAGIAFTRWTGSIYAAMQAQALQSAASRKAAILEQENARIRIAADEQVRIRKQANAALEQAADAGRLRQKQALLVAEQQEALAKAKNAQATLNAIAISRQELIVKNQQLLAERNRNIVTLEAIRNSAVLSGTIREQRIAEANLLAAQQARSVVMTELAVLGRQQAAVNAQLAVATKAAATAQVALNATTAANTLTLANNASATTRLIHDWNEAEKIQRRLTATTGLATKAMVAFRGAVAFLGGPIGAVITALGLGYIAFKQFGEKSGGEMEELKRIVKELNAELEKTPALIKSKVATSFDELAKARDKLERDLTRAKRGKIDFSTGQIFVDEAEIKRIQGLLDASLVRYQELVSAHVDANKKVEESASEAMQAEKFLRDAKIKLMSEEIAAQEKIIEAAKKANIAESDRAAIIKAAQGQIDTLRGKAEKETKASNEAREAMLAYFERTNEAIVKQIELREKMYRDDEAYVAEMANVQIDATQGIYDQIDALREELANRGKLESAIQSSILARTIEKREAMEAAGLNVEAIEDEIAARKKLLDLIIKKERIEAEEKAAEESKRIWEEAEKEKRRAMERTASELSRSITDALLRGFESGKSIAENFRETLKNMFNTLILRPVIEAIVKPVAGALGGIFSTEAFAGTGGGGIGDMLGTLKQGFDSLNGNVVGSIEKLGVFLSNGNGGLADKIGGFLGQHASGVASALSFAPAAMSLLQGDFKGAAFQGAGAAIGTAFGGPVGGAIGSFLGGALGGLFGGSGEKYKQVFQTGSSSFDGTNFSQRKGVDVRAGSAVQNSLSGIQKSFSQNLFAILDEFGKAEKITTGIYARLRRTSGRTAAEFVYSVGGVKGGVSTGIRAGTEMISEFNTGGDYGKGIQQLAGVALGKVLVQAIQRSSVPAGIKKFFDGLTKPEDVAATINAVIGLNRALENVPKVFEAIDFAFMTTKFNVGIKQLQEDFGAVQKYTELFYTQQENFDTFVAQLTSQFGDLGQAFPTTREGFRELVDGINVIDESSYNLFQALVRLAPAMDQYYQALESQFTVLRGIEDFRTRADYQIYSGLARNYGAAAANDRFPMFANGGSHTGGMRVVGERGPELEMTGPSRIIPTSTIMDALSGNSALAVEIRALRMEMQAVVSNTGRSALYNRRVSDLLDRVTPDGDAIRTEAVA